MFYQTKRLILVNCPKRYFLKQVEFETELSLSGCMHHSCEVKIALLTLIEKLKVTNFDTKWVMKMPPLFSFKSRAKHKYALSIKLSRGNNSIIY
jgi:hypothetical protein